MIFIITVSSYPPQAILQTPHIRRCLSFHSSLWFCSPAFRSRALPKNLYVLFVYYYGKVYYGLVKSYTTIRSIKDKSLLRIRSRQSATDRNV